MKGSQWTGLGVALALLGCADRGTGIRPFDGQVKLLKPVAGGRFVQNDSTIGCPAHPYRGYGFRLAFDWEDVPGAHRYDIYLKNTRAQYPAINYHVTESKYELAWCNAFVIDLNLEGWVWRVAAIGAGPTAAEPDTLWSEERTYGFEPCRHANGTPCTAPAPPQ